MVHRLFLGLFGYGFRKMWVKTVYFVYQNITFSLNSLCFSLFFSGPPIDHWALVSGLPTYVAENGFVSLTVAAGQFCTRITGIREAYKIKGS